MKDLLILRNQFNLGAVKRYCNEKKTLDTFFFFLQLLPSPIIYMHYQSGIFVTTDEPTWANNHLK